MARKRPKKYVMFGFNVVDPDITGYLGRDMDKVVDDIFMAKTFTRSLRKRGTPEEWLQMINEDPHLNLGFKFHLVPTGL